MSNAALWMMTSAPRTNSSSSSAIGREERLVGEELVRQAVDAIRVLAVAPLRVDVEVQRPTGEPAVHQLDAADLDDAVARFGAEAGGLGVEEDLAHAQARVDCSGGAARGAAVRPRPHHQSSAPATIIGTHSHCPMLMPSASRPRKLSGSRKYSAMKRSTP